MTDSQTSSEPDPTLGRPYPWSEPGILVGVDGSDAARSALRYAADLAPKLGLSVHALVVWDYPALAWGDWYAPQMVEHLEADAEQLARNEAAKVFPAGVPDWFSIGTRQGNAAAELVAASRTSAMLVVGGRGHGGFAGLLLGSVSSACAAHSHGPVLIVRERSPKAG